MCTGFEKPKHRGDNTVLVVVKMYRTVATAITRGGMATDSGDSVVSLDQVPRWSDAEHRSSSQFEIEDPSFSNSYFPDPLTSPGAESGSCGMASRFPVDHEINSKIYLWRGNPWNLEVDAVVNSTNEVSAKNFVISSSVE